MFIDRVFRLDQPSQTLLLNAIFQTHGVQLTTDDVIFGPPEALNRTRTRLNVHATDVSPWVGCQAFRYDRFDLNKLFFGISLLFPEEISPDDESIRTQIVSNWSVYLDPADIEITFYPAPPQFARRVQIEAKPTALCWVGSIDGWVIPTGLLSELFYLNPGSFNDRHIQYSAYLYSFERQLVDWEPTQLDSFVEGTEWTTLTPPLAQFIETLSSKTGEAWCLVSQQAPWNLYRAKVLYHGPYDLTDSLNRVVVLRLHPRCTSLFGSLVIRYQAPPTPPIEP